ncbi:MAG: hypothetical protein ABIQ40_03745 [Bacteroidia bacterium]
MKFLKRLLIVLLVLSVLGVIGYLARKQLLKQVLPEVENVEIVNITVINDSAYVNVSVMLRNKGWTSYQFNYADITLSNDSLVLVHYVNDSVQKLETNQVRIFPISFVVPIKDVIRRIRNLQDRDSTFISVKGFASFTTMFGVTTKEFSRRIAVEVPTPPDIKLGELIYLGEDKIKDQRYYNFRMKLQIINLNSKEFWFKDVNYNMNAGKQIKSVGKIPGDIRILPLDTAYLDIPFRVTIDNEMKLFFKILFNDDVVTYKLSINGTVAAVAGLKQDIPATFQTSGQVELYDPDRKKVNFTVKKNRKKDKGKSKNDKK